MSETRVKNPPEATPEEIDRDLRVRSAEADGIPIAEARRKRHGDADTLHIDCPYCRREHTHGGGVAGSEYGSGDGHRVSHCDAPGSECGYYLYEVRA